MTKKAPVFNITIPIYEGVDLMDVAAPYEIFNWMGFYWKAERAVAVRLAAATAKIVKTRDNLKLTPDITFAEYDKKRLSTDLLWVPGGDMDHLSKMMKNETYLNFLKKQSEKCVFVTSVCEGAMLLASAGLLDGYEATTHWAFVPCLKNFPAITAAEGYPRFVVDRNRITGGGISSGLDEALEIIARVSSYEIACQVQLVTQYFPQPPINGRIPDRSANCPLDNA
jgi:transcriptional regulator GlxA family with amidase domain